MGTATLTAPITDEGMRMTLGELIEEFWLFAVCGG